jgi:hypothetical protein
MKPPQEAVDALHRMFEVYASCRSYRDHGRVIETYVISDGSRHTSAIPFVTHFIRPRLFRFEFRPRVGGSAGAWLRFVMWQNRHGTDAVQPIGMDFGPDTISGHLAASQGVSRRSSQTVPSLLNFTEVVPTPLLSMKPTAFDRDDTLGVPCLRITGNTPVGIWTIWIERDTGLLRRIDERKEFTPDVLRKLQWERFEGLDQPPEGYSSWKEVERKIDRYAESRAFWADTMTEYHPEAGIDLDEAIFERPIEDQQDSP